MSDEFYEKLYRKIVFQMWLATGITAILSILLSVTVSKLILKSEITKLRSSIRYYSDKNNPRVGIIPVETEADTLIYKEAKHE